MFPLSLLTLVLGRAVNLGSNPSFRLVLGTPLNFREIELGRGGGQLVSVLVFYFDDPSSNPACNLNLMYEKIKTKQKRGRGLPIFEKKVFSKVQRMPSKLN